MRAGIISAARIIFHEIPIRICLIYFLRDPRKDMMLDPHTDLGIMINRIGIRSTLKGMIRSIPDYDQATLYRIEDGYCSRVAMEFIAIRRIVEILMVGNHSSGCGFPFTLKHLSFFLSCKNAVARLSNLMEKLKGNEAMNLGSQILHTLNRITNNRGIVDLVTRLDNINSLIFSRIRKAFMIPDGGNLSDDRYDSGRDDPIVHDQCRIVFGEMQAYEI